MNTLWGYYNSDQTGQRQFKFTPPKWLFMYPICCCCYVAKSQPLTQGFLTSDISLWICYYLRSPVHRFKISFIKSQMTSLKVGGLIGGCSSFQIHPSKLVTQDLHNFANFSAISEGSNISSAVQADIQQNTILLQGVDMDLCYPEDVQYSLLLAQSTNSRSVIFFTEILNLTIISVTFRWDFWNSILGIWNMDSINLNFFFCIWHLNFIT